MNKKSLLKVLVAIGILALALTFLGVVFVPGMYAQSADTKNVLTSSKPDRPVYLDEHSQRTISLAPESSQANALQLYYARSDWIERHPSEFYRNSDWIERHPSNYYRNSDWIERHPSKPVQ